MVGKFDESVTITMAGTNAKADCSSRAQAHAKLVQDVVKEHPSSVLTDAKALDALEAKLMEQLNQNLGSGYMDQVSVAKKKKPVAPAESASDDAARAPSAPSEGASAAERAAPPPAASASPATPPSKPKAPVAKQIWTPCRKAGCKSCG